MSSTHKTLIIAEPGSTHDGQLDNMLRLINVAAACGADVFKSQWTSSAQIMCDRRHAPEYLDSYRLLQYPLEWHGEMRAHAEARGLQYAYTAYIPGDPTLLASFVDYLKISSFENQDVALLDEAYRTNRKRVIVSAGMLDGEQTVKKFRRWIGQPFAVLHCVSAYPAPLDGLNLEVLRPNTEPDEGEYRWFDGFSDHSHDARVGAGAVAAGAQILETHFRLDDCDPENKDYAVAFTPAEFKTYIQNVRDCEAAMGDGVKRVQECEGPMMRYRVTV